MVEMRRDQRRNTRTMTTMLLQGSGIVGGYKAKCTPEDIDLNQNSLRVVTKLRLVEHCP